MRKSLFRWTVAMLTLSAAAVSRAFSTPIFSTTSDVSRIPAVSTKIKLKSPSIICSSRVSLVVPAISVTIALCLPDNALSKDDFPAFGFPTITVRIPSVKTFPLSKESAIFFTAALIF